MVCSLLFNNPFKESGRVVIGQCDLQTHGLGLDRLEVHGTGGARMSGVAVRLLRRQPLTAICQIEDSPRLGYGAASPRLIAEPIDG